jgi:hypothetical protein
MYVKKTDALRGMFLISILGTLSPPGAFPFFSFLIMFMISRGDVYKEESSLNTSLYRAEQLSWTEADWSECAKFTWAKENLDAMALAFSDSVMRVSTSVFKTGIAKLQ